MGGRREGEEEEEKNMSKRSMGKGKSEGEETGGNKDRGICREIVSADMEGQWMGSGGKEVNGRGGRREQTHVMQGGEKQTFITHAQWLALTLIHYRT